MPFRPQNQVLGKICIETLYKSKKILYNSISKKNDHLKGMINMGKISAIIGIAALAGVGFYVGKKLIEKRNAEEEERAQHVYEDDSDVFVEERHSTPKEKLQRASLFAVGAIRTGAEKFKEGIDDIIYKDMVSKGEETVAKGKETAIETKDKAVNFAKTTGENIKTGIDSIKNKVTGKAEEVADETGASELAEAIEKDVDELTDKAIDMAEEIKNSPEPVVEEVQEAADDIDSVSMSDEASDSVETFDFSNPEQL